MPCDHYHHSAGGREAAGRTRAGGGGAPRPIALWLQGGAHFLSNFSFARRAFYEPNVAKARQLAKRCGNASLVVLLSGLNAQDRVLDALYPRQSRENASTFNEELRAYAHAEGAHFVDYLNLTRDAPTSDGYHYLSDVNLAKADVLLHLLRVSFQEGEAPTTPSF